MSGLHPPPNWRWLRVIEIVDTKSRPSRTDDAIIVRAVGFLQRKRVADASRMPRLKQDYPDIYAANHAYEGESEDRWVLEASLCTEVTHERITKDCIIEEPDAVNAYAQLFFDVRPYLASHMYIRMHILQPALRNRSTEAGSPDFALKFVALKADYEILQDNLDFIIDSPESNRIFMLAKNNKTQQLGTEAVFALPLNKYNALEILDRADALDAIRKGEGENMQEMTASAIELLITSIEFSRRLPDDANDITLDGLEPRSIENAEFTEIPKADS